MQNKFIRLLKCDVLLLLRVGVIVIMLVITFVQSNILKSIGKRYALFNTEQALVLKVKAMEQELEARRDGAAKQVVKGMMIYEGALKDKGKFYAIVDSKIYQVGQVVRDYKITSITEEGVVLVNLKTNEQKILQLNINKP